MNGKAGLLYGNPGQLGVQALSVLVPMVFCGLGTFVLLLGLGFGLLGFAAKGLIKYFIAGIVE